MPDKVKNCKNGVYEASGTFEKKAIKQESPHQPPFINMGSCNDYCKCIVVCPFDATLEE